MEAIGHVFQTVQSKKECTIKHLLFFVLFAILLLLLGCSDFTTKSEYAVLQEAECANRQSKIFEAKIITRRGYFIAGFKSEDGKENTWVLLNPKSPPYYKQIPQVNFKISRVDLERIRQMPEVSETVIAVLETRIAPSKE